MSVLRHRGEGHGARRPIIGITPDVSASETDPPVELYQLKASYSQAVFRAGGLPFVLPGTEDPSCIESYLDRIAGLLVTGGAFDIPPAMYGQAVREGMGITKPARTLFELSLTKAALDRNLPVLGICAGMQLLNVILGGTLIQDIAREIPGAHEHEQKHDRRQPQHPVEIKEGTLLAELFGKGQVMVNSTHHQAPKTVGEKVVVSAVAPDGITEAIEVPAYQFAVGVQWHPELLVGSIPIHLTLYKAFVHKARESRR
jgi:putative glutamine amidotransferase